MITNFSGENFMAGIQSYVSKAISKISFDTTEICTIVEKNDDGSYTVNNGSSNFKAFSNESYQKNDTVYVLIPNGDYGQEKTILRKKTTGEDEKIESQNLKFKIAKIGESFVDDDWIQNNSIENTSAAQRDDESDTITPRKKLQEKDLRPEDFASETLNRLYFNFDIYATTKSNLPIDKSLVKGSYTIRLTLQTTIGDIRFDIPSEELNGSLFPSKDIQSNQEYLWEINYKAIKQAVLNNVVNVDNNIVLNLIDGQPQIKAEEINAALDFSPIGFNIDIIYGPGLDIYGNRLSNIHLESPYVNIHIVPKELYFGLDPSSFESTKTSIWYIDKDNNEINYKSYEENDWDQPTYRIIQSCVYYKDPQTNEVRRLSRFSDLNSSENLFLKWYINSNTAYRVSGDPTSENGWRRIDVDDYGKDLSKQLKTEYLVSLNEEQDDNYLENPFIFVFKMDKKYIKNLSSMMIRAIPYIDNVPQSKYSNLLISNNIDYEKVEGAEFSDFYIQSNDNYNGNYHIYQLNNQIDPNFNNDNLYLSLGYQSSDNIINWIWQNIKPEQKENEIYFNQSATKSTNSLNKLYWYYRVPIVDDAGIVTFYYTSVAKKDSHLEEIPIIINGTIYENANIEYEEDSGIFTPYILDEEKGKIDIVDKEELYENFGNCTHIAFSIVDEVKGLVPIDQNSDKEFDGIILIDITSHSADSNNFPDIYSFLITKGDRQVLYTSETNEQEALKEFNIDTNSDKENLTYSTVLTWSETDIIQELRFYYRLNNSLLSTVETDSIVVKMWRKHFKEMLCASYVVNYGQKALNKTNTTFFITPENNKQPVVVNDDTLSIEAHLIDANGNDILELEDVDVHWSWATPVNKKDYIFQKNDNLLYESSIFEDGKVEETLKSWAPYLSDSPIDDNIIQEISTKELNVEWPSGAELTFDGGACYVKIIYYEEGAEEIESSYVSTDKVSEIPYGNLEYNGDKKIYIKRIIFYLKENNNIKSIIHRNISKKTSSGTNTEITDTSVELTTVKDSALDEYLYVTWDESFSTEKTISSGEVLRGFSSSSDSGKKKESFALNLAINNGQLLKKIEVETNDAKIPLRFGGDNLSLGDNLNYYEDNEWQNFNSFGTVLSDDGTFSFDNLDLDIEFQLSQNSNNSELFDIQFVIHKLNISNVILQDEKYFIEDGFFVPIFKTSYILFDDYLSQSNIRSFDYKNSNTNCYFRFEKSDKEIIFGIVLFNYQSTIITNNLFEQSNDNQFGFDNNSTMTLTQSAITESFFYDVIDKDKISITQIIKNIQLKADTPGEQNKYKIKKNFKEDLPPEGKQNYHVLKAEINYLGEKQTAYLPIGYTNLDNDKVQSGILNKIIPQGSIFYYGTDGSFLQAARPNELKQYYDNNLALINSIKLYYNNFTEDKVQEISLFETAENTSESFSNFLEETEDIVQSTGGKTKILNYSFLNKKNENVREVKFQEQDEKYLFVPPQIYFSKNEVCLKFNFPNDKIWLQPPFSMQNNQFSTTVAQWDGITFNGPTESTKGTGFGINMVLGVKNNENQFTGVVAGSLDNDIVEGTLSGKSGIFGFQNGQRTFEINTKGSAYLKGTVVANAGKIGGLTLENGKLYNNFESNSRSGYGINTEFSKGDVGQVTDRKELVGNWGKKYFLVAGAQTLSYKENTWKVNSGRLSPKEQPFFFVTNQGALYAQQANLFPSTLRFYNEKQKDLTYKNQALSKSNWLSLGEWITIEKEMAELTQWLQGKKDSGTLLYFLNEFINISQSSSGNYISTNTILPRTDDRVQHYINTLKTVLNKEFEWTNGTGEGSKIRYKNLKYNQLIYYSNEGNKFEAVGGTGNQKIYAAQIEKIENNNKISYAYYPPGTAELQVSEQNPADRYFNKLAQLLSLFYINNRKLAQIEDDKNYEYDFGYADMNYLEWNTQLRS